jgi:CRISPR-associated protein Cmr4
MYQLHKMLFLYTETPLHVGAGKSVGAVDLPIQRDRVTQYPLLQASGLKGCLRDAVRNTQQKDVDIIFGKAGEQGESYMGALAAADARLLLFPVRSLAGVFAYTTSLHALNTFVRAAELSRLNVKKLEELLAKLTLLLPNDTNRAIVGKDSVLKVGKDKGIKVVLEEFSFEAHLDDTIKTLGEWLAKEVFPTGEAYRYWREQLPKRLCVLGEDAFRDFTLYGTDVRTHVKLDPLTKTVETRALWTTESLPVDSLLYAPILLSDTRRSESNQKLTAAEVWQVLQNSVGERMQFGGDETTGQGWTALRFSEGGGQS